MTKIINFSKKIIIWYQKYGKKTLPWQIKKTPYKTWVSEIMLQQTQVNRVIPYFERFISTFPNIKKLAQSKLDEVLYLWSGLGYYTRAHNLYNTAKIIVNKHNTIFPEDFNVLIKLPGIGRSTAGAILSLSLEKKYPILDSNVKRILTRYYTIKGWLCHAKIEKKLWSIINNIIPDKNISDFNQGLMDLGETLCKKTNPRCALCPLKNECQANLKNVTFLYPNKKPKKIIPIKNTWLLILRYKNTIWVEKCPIGKIWGGLFCFPQFITKKKLYEWLSTYNLNDNQCQLISSFQHKFSHYSLIITPIIFNINIKLNIIDRKYGLWFDLTKPKNIGFPQPMLQLISKKINLK